MIPVFFAMLAGDGSVSLAVDPPHSWFPNAVMM